MAKELTAIIADDEPILRFTLKQALADIWSDLDVVAMASTGQEAWELIQAAKPDIVFLDIRMPEMTGLEVAEKIQKSDFAAATKVVFLTAYDDYAIQAFEQSAVDYLLKPVSEQRLEQTRDRILQRLDAPSPMISLDDLQTMIQRPMMQQPHSRWLNVSKGDDIFIIDVSTVVYFQAEDKYITVKTTQGDYLLRKSLRQLEDELDPEQFWRVHRGTLVQVSHIQRVEKTFTGQLKIHLNQHRDVLAVSRRFAGRFKPS